MKKIRKFLVTLLTACLLMNMVSMTAFASTADTVSAGDAITESVSGNDQTGNLPAEEPQRMVFRMVRRALPEFVEVTDLRLLEKIDGTPDFNADDAPGHDSSANNGILRTLDTVTYNLRMAIQVPENPTREGDADKVMITSFIPGVKSGEVQFLTDSMSWLYEPKVEETEEGLTLTGYTMMDMTAENVYWQDLTFALKAYDMEQGRKFAPQFRAWVEGQEVAAAVTEGTEITVSAKEALNIALLFSEDGKRGIFDFSKDAATKDEQFGYLFSLSLRAELMADGNSLKGVLIPDGDISFDIDLRVWDSTNASVGTVDATEDHMPMVWDYTQSRTGDEKYGELGRVLDGKANGMSIIPYGEYNAQYPDRSVNDSGKLTVVQEGTVLHVTISDYDFGSEIVFPQKTQNGNTFASNAGVFSIGLIQLLVPYEDVPDSLLYTLEATVSEVKLGGKESSQKSLTDDVATRQIQTVSGSWNQMLIISHLDEFIDADSYVDVSNRAYEGRIQGDTYAYPGEELVLTGTFSYPMNGCNWNGSDFLIKVADSIELPEIEEMKVYFTTRNRVNGVYPKSENLFHDIKIRYAAKADGSGWANESEMDDAFITDLVYYDSKEAAAEADAELLGVLFECRSGKVVIDKYRLLYVVPIKVSADAEVDYVYPFTFEAMQYQMKTDGAEAGMTTAHGITHIDEENLDVVNTRIKNLFDALYSQHESDFRYSRSIEKGLSDGSYICTMPHRYVKSAYENGQVKAGSNVAVTSVGTRLGLFGGNSLLIVGAQANIEKTVEQLGADGNPRMVFNLNQNQRIVDYKLQPSYRFPVEYQLQDETDTLTITDTLDKGLTYIAGSSFQGGEYDTTTEELTGGVSLEPIVTVDNSGKQVLTWTLENVKVGEDIEPIHYSCGIDTGVKDGAQLSNTVKITAPSDSRPVTEASGKVSVSSIQVVQSRGAVLNKTVDKEYIELVDEIEYIISFTNHGNDTYENILIKDILPYEGDGRNTNLKGGNYEVTGIELVDGNDGKLYVTAMDRENIATIKDMYEDPAYVTGNLADSQYWKNWEEVSAESDLKQVTAVAAWGDVEGGQTIQIKVRLKVNFLSTKSVLFNNAEVYTEDHQQLTTVNVRSIVLPQRISGLAWLDADKDGIREDGEALLSGIKVLLQDETGAPAKDVWGAEVPSTVTDAQGAYAFDNLAKGKYQVVFELDNYASEETKVSPFMAAGSVEETDCNAVSVYAEDVLAAAKITGIELPDLKDIAEEDLDVLESGHWDLGLYEDKYYKITVNYLEKGTEKVLAEAYVSGETMEDTSYDVTEQSKLVIDGYTFDSITGDVLQGILDSDKVITVYYTKKSSESQSGNGDSSDDGDMSEGSVIIDPEQPPLLAADMLITIDDPMIPLASTPATGDNAPLGATAAGFAAAVGLLMLLLKKKRVCEKNNVI